MIALPECSLFLRALTRLRHKITNKLERIDAMLAEPGLSANARTRLQAQRDELAQALQRSEALAERLESLR